MSLTLTALQEVILKKSTPEVFIKRVLFVAVVVALFGQPNALFVYFPAYPIVLTAIIIVLFVSVVYIKFRMHRFTLPKINLTWPTTFFFLYSIISLIYAPDPGYGARILFSAMFKFLLFLILVTVFAEVEEMHKTLTLISFLGGLFALQGILYIVCFLFFNLQPGDYIGAGANYGSRAYDPGINSLGILGFAKATNQIGSIRLPRCQSMFLEPGFFATFLELSLFATLGWFALTEYKQKRFVYWLIGLQIGALFFTFSSAGLFSITAGLLIYISLRLFTRPGIVSRRRLSLLVLSIAAIVGTVLAACLCFPILAQDIYNAVYSAKFASDATELTSSVDRLSKAADSIALFSQKPIFGWGSNQLPVIAANGASVGNAFLTVATELGIVGLITYLVMLAAIFHTLVDNIRLAYRTQSDVQIGLTAALTGCIIASFIHSMFVDTEWLFSYWISLALVYINRKILLRLTAVLDPEPQLA